MSSCSAKAPKCPLPALRNTYRRSSSSSFLHTSDSLVLKPDISNAEKSYSKVVTPNSTRNYSRAIVLRPTAITLTPLLHNYLIRARPTFPVAPVTSAVPETRTRLCMLRQMKSSAVTASRTRLSILNEIEIIYVYNYSNNSDKCKSTLLYEVSSVMLTHLR